MSRKIRGITIEIGGDTVAINKALADVNKTSRDLKSELRDVERLLKLDPGNTELVSQKQKILAESVENTAKKLETLKEAEKQVQEQFKRGEVTEEQYRAIQREVIKTEEELKKLDKRLREMSWKTVTDNLDKFGNKAVQVGKEFSKKVTAPIVGAGVAATKMASDFTDSMAKVSTLADTTQVSMGDLKKGIMDISNMSGIAATDIASAVYDALSASVETADVLDYVRANILLTKAGFTEMATAIDATSTILNAYGEKAYEVSKIGDILVKTQDEGKITVDELGKNLGRVIPTAAALGVNLDQLGASYSIMTARGQNARIATTNLNSMLVELGKTGSKSDKALRDLTGKSFKDLIASGKTVGDTLGILKDYADKAGLSLSDMFGSTTAGNAALTLLAGGVNEFNNKVNVMNNSTGTMAENFEKLKTPSQEMAIAINKIKNAVIDLGEIILPVLSTFAQWISKVAEKFKGLDDSTKKVIVVVGGLVAAIGPLLVFIGKMSLGLSALIKFFGPLGAGATIAAGAIKVLGAAIAFITSPIGIVIAAVTALIGVFTYLYKSNEDFRNKVVEIWSGIMNFFKGIPAQMQGIGGMIMKGLAFGMLGMLYPTIKVVTSIVNSIVGVFKRLLGIRSPSALFEQYGKYIDEGLAAGIKNNKGTVIDQVQGLVDGIKQTMDKNKDALNRLGSALVDSLKKRYEEMERDQTRALDREIENARKASDEKIAIYDREYTEKLKIIDEEAYRKIKALEDEIEAIDDLTDKEEKAIRDTEHREKVSELKKQLMAAETAEERLRIQKDIDTTIENYERTLLLEKRRDKKDSLRDEIQDIRDSVTEKKDELKQELEDRKQAEKEILEAVVGGLDDQKTELAEHYKELTTTEALEAEARKLMIEKNNDEIIALLKTYNPKWQNAGQSFAESIIDGLNSEKKPMEEAIADLFDFQDTIEERAEALEVLEDKLESLRSGSAKGGGGAGGGAGGGLINDVTGMLDLLGDGLDEVMPKLEEFGETVVEVTTETIEGFLRMEEKTRIALYELTWGGMAVTEEMKNTIVSNVGEMTDKVVEKLREQKEEGLRLLEEKLKKSTDLSEEEKKEALRIAGERYDKEIEKAQESKDRIEEILEEALKTNSRITEDEKKEIEGILEGLKKRSIELMTDSRDEQEKILNGLKDNATGVSVEMASEIIKNSLKRKNETIEHANEEYREVLKAATALKEDGSKEAIELADKMIAEAKRQKRETVEQAEEMHENILKEVKKQGDDVVRQLELDSGEIKNVWTKLRDWFKGNPITRIIKTSEQGSTGGGSGSGGGSSYAKGTDFHPGGLAWVGELGPELVELPRGSKVHTNKDSMDMMNQKVEHTGTITVKGVNDRNELIGVVDIVMDELRRGVRA